MAPWPQDGEPKAPDKKTETVNVDGNSRGDNEEVEQITATKLDQKSDEKEVLTLDEGQLKALLDEAITYKNPKDREGKSELFKELLQEAEADESESKGLGNSLGAKFPRGYYNNLPVRRRQSRHGGQSREGGVGVSSTRGGSLQNLHALGMEGGRRSRKRETLVSARQREGGSLPTNVNVDNDTDLDIICPNYTSRATLEVSNHTKEEQVSKEEPSAPTFLKTQGHSQLPNGTEAKDDETKTTETVYASSIKRNKRRKKRANKGDVTENGVGERDANWKLRGVGPVESGAMLYPSTPVQHVSVLSIPPSQIHASSDDHRISDSLEAKKLNVSRSGQHKKSQSSEETENASEGLLGLPLTATAHWNRYSSFTLLDFPGKDKAEHRTTRINTACGPSPVKPRPKPYSGPRNSIADSHRTLSRADGRQEERPTLTFNPSGPPPVYTPSNPFNLPLSIPRNLQNLTGAAEKSRQVTAESGRSENANTSDKTIKCAAETSQQVTAETGRSENATTTDKTIKCAAETSQQVTVEPGRSENSTTMDKTIKRAAEKSRRLKAEPGRSENASTTDKTIKSKPKNGPVIKGPAPLQESSSVRSSKKKSKLARKLKKQELKSEKENKNLRKREDEQLNEDLISSQRAMTTADYLQAIVDKAQKRLQNVVEKNPAKYSLSSLLSKPVFKKKRKLDDSCKLSLHTIKEDPDEPPYLSSSEEEECAERFPSKTRPFLLELKKERPSKGNPPVTSGDSNDPSLGVIDSPLSQVIPDQSPVNPPGVKKRNRRRPSKGSPPVTSGDSNDPSMGVIDSPLSQVIPDQSPVNPPGVKKRNRRRPSKGNPPVTSGDSNDPSLGVIDSPLSQVIPDQSPVNPPGVKKRNRRNSCKLSLHTIKEDPDEPPYLSSSEEEECAERFPSKTRPFLLEIKKERPSKGNPPVTSGNSNDPSLGVIDSPLSQVIPDQSPVNPPGVKKRNRRRRKAKTTSSECPGGSDPLCAPDIPPASTEECIDNNTNRESVIPKSLLIPESVPVSSSVLNRKGNKKTLIDWMGELKCKCDHCAIDECVEESCFEGDGDSCLPDTVSVSPQPTVSVSPQPAVSVSPQPAVSVSPQPTVSVSPQPAVSVSPQPTVSVSPQPKPSPAHNKIQSPEASKTSEEDAECDFFCVSDGSGNVFQIPFSILPTPSSSPVNELVEYDGPTFDIDDNNFLPATPPISSNPDEHSEKLLEEDQRLSIDTEPSPFDDPDVAEIKQRLKKDNDALISILTKSKEQMSLLEGSSKVLATEASTLNGSKPEGGKKAPCASKKHTILEEDLSLSFNRQPSDNPEVSVLKQGLKEDNGELITIVTNSEDKISVLQGSSKFLEASSSTDSKPEDGKEAPRASKKHTRLKEDNGELITIVTNSEDKISVLQGSSKFLEASSSTDSKPEDGKEAPRASKKHTIQGSSKFLEASSSTDSKPEDGKEAPRASKKHTIKGSSKFLTTKASSSTDSKPEGGKEAPRASKKHTRKSSTTGLSRDETTSSQREDKHARGPRRTTDKSSKLTARERLHLSYTPDSENHHPIPTSNVLKSVIDSSKNSKGRPKKPKSPPRKFLKTSHTQSPCEAPEKLNLDDEVLQLQVLQNLIDESKQRCEELLRLEQMTREKKCTNEILRAKLGETAESKDPAADLLISNEPSTSRDTPHSWTETPGDTAQCSTAIPCSVKRHPRSILLPKKPEKASEANPTNASVCANPNTADCAQARSDSNTRLAFSNVTDGKTKPLDENGNALACVRMDSNCLDRKKQRRVKAKNDRNTILSDEIEGFRGAADIDTLMEYIESPSLDSKSSKARSNQSNGTRNSVKVRSKEEEPKSIKRRKERLQRCNSLEEISKTKLEDLTEEGSSERVNGPSLPLTKKHVTLDDAELGMKSSWDVGEETASMITKEKKPERVSPEPVQESEFHVVTKKQRKKKRRTGCGSRGGSKQDYYGGREGGSNRLLYQYRRDQGTSQPRRKSASSVPPSDKSDSSDLDSVHSLPVSSSARTRAGQNSVSGGSTPQASYADIAKTAASPPDGSQVNIDRHEKCSPNSSFSDNYETNSSPQQTLPTPLASLKKDAMTDTTCDTTPAITTEDYPPLEVKSPETCTEINKRSRSVARDIVAIDKVYAKPDSVIPSRTSGDGPRSLPSDVSSVKSADSLSKRPPVILMDEPSRGDSRVPELEFGFPVNYLLLQSENECNEPADSPPQIPAVPTPAPVVRDQGCYSSISDPNLVQYLSSGWEEIMEKVRSGKAHYYNGQ